MYSTMFITEIKIILIENRNEKFLNNILLTFAKSTFNIHCYDWVFKST